MSCCMYMVSWSILRASSCVQTKQYVIRQLKISHSLRLQKFRYLEYQSTDSFIVRCHSFLFIICIHVGSNKNIQ